jgi:hypothetical protein
LTGSVKVSAGFFFNVAPRHDMATNFHRQIVNNLSLRTKETGLIPDFQIEVYPLHGHGGTKVHLYRMLTSSVTNVQILTKKMALLLPKPTTDISCIPQEVWGSLLPTKKAEYTTMQRVFEQNHNSRLFVGLKNAKLKLGRTVAGGSTQGHGTAGISIYDWLTRVKAADGCNMFSKVFECDNGDVELWHHVSHGQEARAWMLTALAEIARLSGIDMEADRNSAEAMFKNQERVWASMRKLHTGVSLPAQQRSVFMDFSPPTGVITFLYCQTSRGKQRRGQSEVKLVFNIEAASTISVLTTDDTKSKASSRSRRKKNQGSQAGQMSSAATTVTEDDGDKAAALAAAKTAIQIADAAVAIDSPKIITAHQGAYATIADKFGNLLPVVMVEGKWVALTPATLRESRKKAPPMNFGLAARMPNHTLTEGIREAKPETRQHEPTVQATITPILAAEMTATVPSQTEGFVQTQATSINARIEARPITLAPVTVFGKDDFPPLAAIEAAISASIAPRGDTAIDTTNYPNDNNMDEHDEDDELDDDGLYTSYDVRSTMSASTAGQSIVTFSQVAQRQAYDVSAEADVIMHHSDCEEEEMQYPTTSSIAKLEKKTKKAKKKSSLAVALIHSELDKRKEAALPAKEAPTKPPI